MELPPLGRRLLLGKIDLLLIPLAIWLSFWLRTAYPCPLAAVRRRPVRGCHQHARPPAAWGV